MKTITYVLEIGFGEKYQFTNREYAMQAFKSLVCDADRLEDYQANPRVKDFEVKLTAKVKQDAA